MNFVNEFREYVRQFLSSKENFELCYDQLKDAENMMKAFGGDLHAILPVRVFYDETVIPLKRLESEYKRLIASSLNAIRRLWKRQIHIEFGGGVYHGRFGAFILYQGFNDIIFFIENQSGMQFELFRVLDNNLGLRNLDEPLFILVDNIFVENIV